MVNCPHCPGRSFATVESLRQHQRSSSNWHPYCDECDRSFVDENAYEMHTASKHPKYPCNKCNREFRSEGALEDHYRGSSEHPSCEACRRGFKNYRAYQSHMSSKHPRFSSRQYSVKQAEHYLEPTNRVSCPRCHLGFGDDSAYIQHAAFFHPECRCKPCQHQFTSIEGLERHYFTSPLHPKCLQCEVGFKDDESNNLHLLSVHDSSQRPQEVQAETAPTGGGVGSTPTLNSLEVEPLAVESSSSSSDYRELESVKSPITELMSQLAMASPSSPDNSISSSQEVEYDSTPQEVDQETSIQEEYHEETKTQYQGEENISRPHSVLSVKSQACRTPEPQEMDLGDWKRHASGRKKDQRRSQGDSSRSPSAKSMTEEPKEADLADWEGQSSPNGQDQFESGNDYSRPGSVLSNGSSSADDSDSILENRKNFFDISSTLARFIRDMGPQQEEYNQIVEIPASAKADECRLPAEGDPHDDALEKKEDEDDFYESAGQEKPNNQYEGKRAYEEDLYGCTSKQEEDDCKYLADDAKCSSGYATPKYQEGSLLEETFNDLKSGRDSVGEIEVPNSKEESYGSGKEGYSCKEDEFEAHLSPKYLPDNAKFSSGYDTLEPRNDHLEESFNDSGLGVESIMKEVFDVEEKKNDDSPSDFDTLRIITSRDDFEKHKDRALSDSEELQFSRSNVNSPSHELEYSPRIVLQPDSLELDHGCNAVPWYWPAESTPILTFSSSPRISPKLDAESHPASKNYPGECSSPCSTKSPDVSPPRGLAPLPIVYPEPATPLDPPEAETEPTEPHPKPPRASESPDIGRSAIRTTLEIRIDSPSPSTGVRPPRGLSDSTGTRLDSPPANPDIVCGPPSPGPSMPTYHPYSELLTEERPPAMEPSPITPAVRYRLHCRACHKEPCEDMTATMCGHVFCYRCITEAVIKSSRCPVCRTPTLLYCLFRLDLSV